MVTSSWSVVARGRRRSVGVRPWWTSPIPGSAARSSRWPASIGRLARRARSMASSMSSGDDGDPECLPPGAPSIVVASAATSPFDAKPAGRAALNCGLRSIRSSTADNTTSAHVIARMPSVRCSNHPATRLRGHGHGERTGGRPAPASTPCSSRSARARPCCTAVRRVAMARIGRRASTASFPRPEAPGRRACRSGPGGPGRREESGSRSLGRRHSIERTGQRTDPSPVATAHSPGAPARSSSQPGTGCRQAPAPVTPPRRGVAPTARPRLRSRGEGRLTVAQRWRVFRRLRKASSSSP